MKKIGIAIAITVYFCNFNQQAIQEINSMPSSQFVDDYFATFNQHNWQKLSEFYADSTMLKDPAFGLLPIKQSKLDIQKKYEVLHQSITDVHDSVVKIYTAKDHVIVEFLSRGTAPDGVTFSLPICTIFGFENGKIVEDFTYYDNF
jgi:ketosteroid isomerase-like protein